MEFPVIYGVNNEIDTSRDVTWNDFFSTLSTFSSFVTRCKHDVLYIISFHSSEFCQSSSTRGPGILSHQQVLRGIPGCKVSLK